MHRSCQPYFSAPGRLIILHCSPWYAPRAPLHASSASHIRYFGRNKKCLFMIHFRSPFRLWISSSYLVSYRLFFRFFPSSRPVFWPVVQHELWKGRGGGHFKNIHGPCFCLFEKANKWGTILGEYGLFCWNVRILALFLIGSFPD